MAGMAWPLQGRASLGSQHLGDRDARAPSWRGLEGWSAQVAADQDGGGYQVGMLGFDEGEHWGSGDEHHTTPGTKRELLDKVMGAGL
jgi:hypothetical protein